LEDDSDQLASTFSCSLTMVLEVPLLLNYTKTLELFIVFRKSSLNRKRNCPPCLHSNLTAFLVCADYFKQFRIYLSSRVE